MSRNRMKNSQSLHWMGVLKWILIIGLMSVLGLSYMLCKNKNLHVAQEASDLKKQLGIIQNRNTQLELDLARMKSPDELKRRLVQMHSTLVWVGNLTVIPMDQSTRMRLVKMADPNHTINLDSPVATTDIHSIQH